MIVYKYSEHRGIKRLLIALKIGVILAFSKGSLAEAKDNYLFLSAGAYQNKAPITRQAPNRNNRRYFEGRTSNRSGSPKKDPGGGGNGIPQKPKMEKAPLIPVAVYINMQVKQRPKNILNLL